MKYKKIEDTEFHFTNGFNIISGTNGTCKTSLLQIISNSHQAVKNNGEKIKEKKVLDAIKRTNNISNAKIESLTRGDKARSDPAPDIRGTLFTVNYDRSYSLDFRRHNSDINERYSLKPTYKTPGDKLPSMPVIYLGITRLHPYGEFCNDQSVGSISGDLPIEYMNEIAKFYALHTGISISVEHAKPQKMGDIKIRSDFTTKNPGIDSNTISAGEDNLYIILHALMSLRYYYENIDSDKEVESLLLIDELDATLHPSLQIKLIDLFNEYSEKYKIQIIVTTHSLSSIEYALEKKCNVIYLIDQTSVVYKMQDVNMIQIKMYLHNKTRSEMFQNKQIPVFLEDKEARLFFHHLLKSRDNPAFRYFYTPDISLSSETIKGLFSDFNLNMQVAGTIGVVDGDHTDMGNINNRITCLPGKDSPEKVIMEYAMKLFEDHGNDFWTRPEIIYEGYSVPLFRESIKPDIESIEKRLNDLKKEGKTTHGKTREFNKEIFRKHQKFFEYVMDQWISDFNSTLDGPHEFFSDLRTLFYKVCQMNGIDMREWKG